MPEKQYVIFVLDGEHYGIDISSILEITRYEVPTKIPNIPEYMEGIINLRESIIPIINLRKRFNLKKTDITGETRIIVISFQDRKTGLLVDAVYRVTKISDGEIEPPRETVAGKEPGYIAGIAKKEGGIILLLEPSAVLA